jgi:phosphate transport system substrate-binding protein
LKKHLTIALACLIGLLPIMSLASFAQDTSRIAIRVNGAATSSDQVELWARSFMDANPTSRIVVTGSSAGKGFESFLSKNADIVIATRPISPQEEKKAMDQGMRLGERPIGYSGLAVITSAKNPVSELTMTQLRKIFSGEYTSWKEVGGPDSPVRCFTRRVPESGAALFFQDKVLEKQPYGSTTTMADSWTTIIKVCATANDLPIGIAPVIPALAAADKIRVLGVKEDANSSVVKPSEETVKNKSYPIFLAFRFYWDENAVSTQSKQFIEFCASKGLPSQN